ncbi:MAG: hypothetical protein RL077_434 [Verrucomicrobiota bacterium]|jgi:hypothetical protein
MNVAKGKPLMNMPTLGKKSAAPSSLVRRSGLARVQLSLGLVTLLFSAGSSLVAQNAAGGADAGGRRRGGATDDPNADRRNMSPEDMQARMLTSLRERFEVTDDEEWKLIAQRLAAVMEQRRSAGGVGGMGGMGGMFGRGGPPGGGGGGTGGGQDPNRASRGGRGTGASNSELTLLSNAVRDKLPDAEIKSRLERVREMRRENELKLAKAQEEFRAVLSVRQEALAVVSGLLP